MRIQRRRWIICARRRRRTFPNIFRWSNFPCLFIVGSVFLVALIILLLLINSILIYQSNRCCVYQSETIVSLTSAPARFRHELPLAVHSLLSQTHLPKRIHIRLASTSNLTLAQLKRRLKKLDSSVALEARFDRIVRINYAKKDHGPATKFLPIIREYHTKMAANFQSQPILICDDDQYYHPHTIMALNSYARKYPTSIIGLRGWRIRHDLRWGVRNGDDVSTHHVIHADNIAEPYRVGIITANNGYLVRPMFFDSHFYLDFPDAPLDVRHVDDIWLSGYAAKRNISRYVIPSCCRHISVIRTHVLEEHLGSHQIKRSSANDHALQWFRNAWEKDIWYRFHSINRPIYRSWLTAINREWNEVIQWITFVFHFGFAYD